jgi:hypothetical protein
MGDNGHEFEANRVIGFGMRAFSMKHPAIAQIDAYWEALRGDRQVPLRAEVDPRGIDQALENAFILERIAPTVARFRLAGTHLNELMGMEVRGMPVTALFDPADRATVTALLEHVFEEPAKARLRLEAAAGAWTQSGPVGELILLPLRSDLGDISRALGCLVTDGAPLGRAPHRFHIAAEEIRPLQGMVRAVRPSDYPAPETRATEDTALHEAGTPYADDAESGQGSTRAPHLRLVHDSDRKD